jgi:molybdenum cofactor cytidylyltransferase
VGSRNGRSASPSDWNRLSAEPAGLRGLSAGLVLAAGGSSRMGSPKQLLPIRGRPLLELVLAAAGASRLDRVLVVLGGNAERIAAEVDLGRARVVLNLDYASGMASSLRVGLAALDPDVQRVAVILGDQPDISAALLDELLDLQFQEGLPAAALSFGGLLHPPVVLDRRLWPELSSLEGDVGCRALIRSRPELVASLPVSDDARHPIDIDTPDDYRRLVSQPPP